MTGTIETRAFQVRETEHNSRTFTGIAVPWDTPADIGGMYMETFERGAVEVPASGRVLLYWRHDEPIGLLTAWEDVDEGWRVEAHISETARGDEAYTLLRDGVVGQLSVGFVPIEHREDDETGTVTRTRVEVREVSVVPFGAYGVDAVVTDVRALAATDNTNAASAAEGASMPDNTITAAEVADLRGSIEDLARTVEGLRTHDRDEAPVIDTRSAGEILKNIVSGDEATIRAYTDLHERAYTGGTTSDAVVKPGWIGDLTRIFDASSGVLSAVFSTGTLPSTGNSLEYAQLKSNTIDVAAQASEGADIGFGKVTIETKTASVATYAGGTQLSRQSIERSTVGVLNTSLQALAMAAGARKKALLRAAYDTLVTAREAVASDGGVVSLGATLAAATAGDWEDALIDAALAFEAVNLAPEALIVSGSVFKALRALTVSGERVFQVAEKNASGAFDLLGLTGSFAGLPVHLDSGQTGDSAVFANGRALRAYDSPLISLTDENIVNLSKSFAVYRYGAIAPEIPEGVIPVKIAAA